MARGAFAVLLTGALVAGWAAGAAAQDAQKGEQTFNGTCALCHSTEEGEIKIGPPLAKVVGRKAGTVPGYTYSDAMAKSGLTWDKATLDKYLTDPRTTVDGTKMIFAGVKDAGQRANVIAYLESLK